MANIDIYGCYNSGTKEISFVGDACDSGNYTGCYVTSGEHEGMIAVVVSEANCDDTYYACFDSNTGQFKLTIPDNCCEYGYGGSCSLCPTPSQTPLTISVTFSGITLCEECFGSQKIKRVINFDVNDTFLLTQIEGVPCYWISGVIGTVTETYPSDPIDGCETGEHPNELNMCIMVRKTSTDVRVYFGGSQCDDGNNREIFLSSAPNTSKCLNGNYNNSYSSTYCNYASYYGYDGIATIEELS